MSLAGTYRTKVVHVVGGQRLPIGTVVELSHEEAEFDLAQGTVERLEADAEPRPMTLEEFLAEARARGQSEYRRYLEDWHARRASPAS